MSVCMHDWLISDYICQQVDVICHLNAVFCLLRVFIVVCLVLFCLGLLGGVFFVFLFWVFFCLFFVLFFKYHVDLCNESYSDRQPDLGPAALYGKNFIVGPYKMPTAQPIFFIPTMLISTIDLTFLYHFYWPWPSLKVTRSAKSKTYWLDFHLYFSSDRMKFDVVMTQFKLNILKLFF